MASSNLESRLLWFVEGASSNFGSSLDSFEFIKYYYGKQILIPTLLLQASTPWFTVDEKLYFGCNQMEDGTASGAGE